MYQSHFAVCFLAASVLSACGGGGGSNAPAIIDPSPTIPDPDPAPVDPTPVEPTPVDPTPVEPTPVDPTPVDPTPVDPLPTIPSMSITLSQINTNASDFSAFINDLDESDPMTDLIPFDSIADLRAGGNATYDGAFYVYNSAARVDGYVGNAALAIGFADPNRPSVTGGADGFIYVDGPELAEVVESNDFSALPSGTPIFAADGAVVFSNGELTNTEGVATAAFYITGKLSADTGGGTSQSVNVAGAMAVLFDDDAAFGVGGNIDSSGFDLNSPEAFFYGTAN